MTRALATVVVDQLTQLGVVVDGGAVAALEADGCLILRESSNRLLLVGVPGVGLATQQTWLGGIVVGVWPRFVFERQRLAIVSSRLTRKLGQHVDWFDAFRTLVCQLEPNKSVLLTADGTTADRFVLRASALFGLPVCSVQVADQPAEAVINSFGDNTSPLNIQLSVPLVTQQPEPIPGPATDRALLVLANQVRALRVASGSQTESLLQRRLNDKAFPPASVHVSGDADTTDALVDAGAISRIFLKTQTEATTEYNPSNQTCLTQPPFDDYLLHWTRSPDGPWPDEQPDDYLDSLILGVEAIDRTAFAALSRILQTGCLLASSHLIRGETKVVCFSDVEICKLHERRVYRRHLHRWDFEPYGIGVRKSVLTRFKVKPVVYGEAHVFDQLEPDQQPFFQLAESSSGVDWQSEKEWRAIGDVSLTDLKPEDVFLFAPTEHEALRLSEMCSWPAVVVPSATD